MDLIMLSDILLFSIAFAFLIFASVTDIKRREVPNWLCFSLIAIAFAIRILASVLTSQFSYLFYAIIAFILFFALANVLYYAKFFGGGDAKLIIALAIVFATTPSFITMAASSLELFQEPFLLSFLINTFFLGSVYSIFFIIFFAIKNYTSLRIEIKKLWRKNKTMRIIFIILAIVSLALTYFSTLFILFPIIILLFPFLYTIVKATENSCMIKLVSPKELTEGDWLVGKIKLGKKIIKPSVHGLNSKDIATLRKANKKVLIKYGIPFVPVFLIALVATALFGDLIVLIIKAFFF